MTIKNTASSFLVSVAAVVSAFAGELIESPRELPLEKEVDVLVLGGGSAALSAAVAAAKEGASVFLAAPRPYVGDDVAGTLRIFEGRKLVPISHKRACDEALKAAGVAYLTGLFPSEVLVGDDGAVAGAVLVSKSGRAAVRAGHVLDCTDHAAFARAAGVPFQPFAGGKLAFERTVVTKEEPKADGMTVVERRDRPLKSGKVYVCRFEHEMKDLSYASFAEAEQRARDLTWTPSELDAADRLRFVPPVCATGTLDHLTLVDAWAEKDPAKREAALDPAVAEKLGEAAGRAAAKDARARGRKGKVRVAVHAPHGRARSPSAPHEDAGDADTKEFLWGFRPFDRGLAKVGTSANALPVLGEYDVVVVGGGTSGGPATIASARAGAKTLLLEYQYALGGVSTIGMIGKYWYGNKCGFTAELERGVKAMGVGVYVNAKAEWMRREARKGGAEMWFGVMGCGAVVWNGRVAGVVVATPCGRGVVLAKDVIDATGNSDIAAAAGAETEFISDEEIVIQDAGTPVRDLGSRYANSDWGFVNDSDAYDVWLFEMRGRRGAKTYWDMPGVVGSRERRRIKSAYAPTVVDMVSCRTFPDTVVCAQSDFDSHGSTDDPFCMFKCLMVRTTMHINVPYRSMVPEKLDGVAVTGLGVGAKHDALPIMRMQADLHNLGYVAGLAAAQAASRGCELRDVDVHDLQLELVKEKIIPKAVLTWKDSLPDDAAFAAAVRACADEGYPCLDTVLLRPKNEALSALRAAYAAEGDAKRRLRYAAILGIYRDPTGADALVDFFTGKGPEIVFPVRKRRNGSPVDPRGRRLGGREMMLIALGRTRDLRAVPVIAAEAEKISADCWIGLTRTVALAAEGLANPKLAPALEAALRRPGVMGHAVKSIDELAPGGGFKILPEVYEGLCELNLARALLACDDPNGLARSIFESYAADPRGVWALHARKVLSKCSSGAEAVVGNPLSTLIGRPVGDPHMIEWKGRLYMFAGHDFSLESKGYDLRDWWVWSSSDLLDWKLESVLKPEDTFLKRPFNSCWATFGVPFPDGWRYYFSAGPSEIGVVTAKTPAGPWRDPLGKPLVAKGEYKTESRDPDVLLDDDGSAYIVFGTFKYFIAKLGADGLSLAEEARPVVIDGAFGPYGYGKTDDKPSLHKCNGLYYLSWSSFYAVSTNVYGPYRYRGSVIDAAYVSPKFRRDRIELHYDRHGNFFQFNGQWYYVANDYSQPGRTRFFRDAVMGYVHYRDNGDIAPVRIDEVGVGQYDASRGEIEAEDYFDLRGGATVGECPVGGFELRMGDGSAARYPNIRNVPANATLSIALWSKAGCTLEFREGKPDGRILGTARVRKGRAGHFVKNTTGLQNAPGTLDLWIVAKGVGGEPCRIDWFKFCP